MILYFCNAFYRITEGRGVDCNTHVCVFRTYVQVQYGTAACMLGLYGCVQRTKAYGMLNVWHTQCYSYYKYGSFFFFFYIYCSTGIFINWQSTRAILNSSHFSHKLYWTKITVDTLKSYSKICLQVVVISNYNVYFACRYYVFKTTIKLIVQYSIER